MTAAEDLEYLRDRLGECEDALADARAERDEADMRAAELEEDPAGRDRLQARLDRIVSFLRVERDMRGHGAAWAEQVVHIARGDLDTTGGDPTA